MRFYAHTIPGFEEIAAEEIAARLESARIEETRRGVVHFGWSGDARALMRLGTTEDVFVLLARERAGPERSELRRIVRSLTPEAVTQAVSVRRAARPGTVKRITFRVVSQRSGGEFEYRRSDVGEAVSAAIRRMFPRWKEAPDDAHLEFWAGQDARELRVGLRLSDRTMRHRRGKTVHLEASLRPTAARCLAWVSEPTDRDVVLDPMCGAGTLLVERAELGRCAALIGGDIRREAVEAAAANFGAKYLPNGLFQWDAARLPLEAGSVTRILCNLPFGKKIGSAEENAVLYPAFLREAERVLSVDGRLVLLTGDSNRLARCLGESGVWETRRRLRAEILGEPASLFVAARQF